MKEKERKLPFLMNDEKPDDISKQQQAKIHIIKAITRIAAAGRCCSRNTTTTTKNVTDSKSKSGWVGLGSARSAGESVENENVHSFFKVSVHSPLHVSTPTTIHPLSQIEPSPQSSPCQTDRPIFRIAAN